MKKILLLCSLILVFSCQKHSSDKTTQEAEIKISENEKLKPSILSIKKKLQEQGYQIFDYIEEETGDTILMQQYFIAFLKKGPNRSQSKEEVDSLQKLHLEHLGKMYKEGYTDISGPLGDDGDIRGITIYNTPTLKIADSLANSDPMVQTGRLTIEIHPWWAAKGFGLR